MKTYTNINEKIPKNCVASIGFFDGVHIGHKYLIKQLQERADTKGVEELLISLWPHPSILFNRPIKLLSTLEEKTELFKSLNIKNVLFLDFTHKIASMSKYDFTKEILQTKLNISELIMGYNNSFGSKNNNLIDNKNEINLKISKLGKTIIAKKDVNSSIIRDLIQNGNVEDAEILLGYSYYISGKIVSGYQIGRKIGFPTGNLDKISDIKLIPQNGVYIIEVLTNGKWHPAMLNIGTRPSFDGKQKSIEFHILNFNADLYNKDITIRFRKKIREEIKFKNTDALISQLKADKDETIKFFN